MMIRTVEPIYAVFTSGYASSPQAPKKKPDAKKTPSQVCIEQGSSNAFSIDVKV